MRQYLAKALDPQPNSELGAGSSDDDIRIYTNKVLQQNLVADAKTCFSSRFPTGDLTFNKAAVIIEKVKRIVDLALEVITKSFPIR